MSLSSHVLALQQKIEALDRDEAICSLTFIAHSQGGLLARQYLCNQWHRKDSGALQALPIYRLLTFATPHWGAFSSWLQKGLAYQNLGQQPADLGYDAPAVLSLNQDWSRLKIECRVDMLRVIAAKDWAVPEFSALGADYAHNHQVVPGHGHSSVVKVKDVEHPSYAIAKEFLTRPLAFHSAMTAGDDTVPVLKHALLASKDVIGASQRLLYLARWVPMLGREAEWKELQCFIQNPSRQDGQAMCSRVAWLSVEGIGGVGKSRLALELCLALQQTDWHAGFLSRESSKPPDWTRWQPRLPTLIVVDYATTDPAWLSDLLIGLCQRDPGHELQNPVRLLLLDRTDQGARLAQAIGSGALSAHVLNARHYPRAQPPADTLSLKPVSAPWPLIDAYLKRLAPGMRLPDEATVLKVLRGLDPVARPLYALILADALASGIALSQLNQGREILLANLINRERDKFWRPAAELASQTLSTLEPLLVAATVSAGLARSELEGSALPRGLAPWRDEARTALHAMSGYDLQTSQIAPLQPDLLGEYFVIQHWRDMDAVDRSPWMAWLFASSPIQTAVFLDRVRQDFPDQMTLAESAMGVPLASKLARLAWGLWAVNLIIDLSKQDPGKALATYGELCALAAAHPLEPKLRLRQAQAAVSLITDLGAQEPDKAQAMYGELRALAAAYPQEPELCLEQAKAAFNLIIDLRKQDPDKAQAMYGELCALATAHPLEPELRLRQAQAAFNLINDLTEHDLDKAQAMYGELCALAAAHPLEPELRLRQAKAAVSLITDLGAQEPDEAQAMYGELRALAAAWPAEKPLQDVHLEGLVSAIRLLHDVKPQWVTELMEEWDEQLREFLRRANGDSC